MNSSPLPGSIQKICIAADIRGTPHFKKRQLHLKGLRESFGSMLAKKWAGNDTFLPMMFVLRIKSFS